MATNTHYNVADVAKGFMKNLEPNLVVTPHVSTEFESRFKANGKIGDTVNINYPATFPTVRTGRQAAPSNISSVNKPLTVGIYGCDLEVTDMEKLLNIDDFSEEILAPLAISAATHVESAIISKLAELPLVKGVPGTALNSLLTFNQAKNLLMKAGCVDVNNLVCVLDSDLEPTLIEGLKSLLNPSAEIGKLYQSGYMGKASGINFKSSPNVPKFTMSTFGTSTPAVHTTAPADGATQVSTDGWASGATAIAAGTCISFAGCYVKNPVTGVVSNELRTFRVTEAASDTSGAIAALKIEPALSLSGLNPVSALPVDGTLIYVWGTGNNASSADVISSGFLFHKDAIQMATLALPSIAGVKTWNFMAKSVKMPIRITEHFDAHSGNILIRCDFCYGVAMGRDNWGCKIVS